MENILQAADDPMTPEYNDLPRKFREVIERLEAKAGPAALRKQAKVETDKDWELVRDLWQVFKWIHPDKYLEHVEDIKKLRKGHYNKYAAADKEHGGSTGSLRHIAQLPPVFNALLDQFFPSQDLNKRFVRRLVREVPELQVPHKV